LTVEVTYAGKPLSPLDDLRASFEQSQAQFAFKMNGDEWLRECASRLAWMKKLESLVLIKLGSNATCASGERVISSLLDSLVRGYLFPREDEQTPSPLRKFWIQNFEVYSCPALRYSSPDSLQSYRSGDCGGRNENYEVFCNIEHLGGSIGMDFSHPLPSLKKLKYASGTSHDDAKVNNAFRIGSLPAQIYYKFFQFYKFCEAHPELVDLIVEHWCFRPDLVNDAVCRLPKLKTFSCRRLISKG